MHELSITRNIIAIVTENADGQKVCKVKLAIGKLCAISSEAIHFCFDACIKGTVLEGAELQIENVDGRGKCDECGSEMSLEIIAPTCTCGSRRVVCIAGQELLVREIEVE